MLGRNKKAAHAIHMVIDDEFHFEGRTRPHPPISDVRTGVLFSGGQTNKMESWSLLRVFSHAVLSRKVLLSSRLLLSRKLFLSQLLFLSRRFAPEKKTNSVILLPDPSSARELKAFF